MDDHFGFRFGIEAFDAYFPSQIVLLEQRDEDLGATAIPQGLNDMATEETGSARDGNALTG
jgi:hypothetical protein